MSILKDLYYGEINPAERYVKKESNYYKLSEQLTENIDKFTKQLNDQEKQLFEKITDSIYYINGISEEECYTKGFCTGAKMILEILAHKSDNFIDLN